MPDDIKEQFIDLSARAKLKIKIADQDEVERSNKLFLELNKSIENDIKEYNEQLDSYIAELQKKEMRKKRKKIKIREKFSSVCRINHTSYQISEEDMCLSAC